MILYKYFPPNEYSFRALASKGLWCHYPRMMNDPFECLGLVKRSFTKEKLEILREFLQPKSHDPLARKLLLLSDADLAAAVNNFRSKEIEKYAFCALSETYDDILLWSHYAYGHRGFVIGFVFPELDNNHHLRQVRYLDKLDDFDLLKWAAVLFGDERHNQYLFDDISVKSKHWAYEKEWRIWRKDPCYYSYQPSNVHSIYLGINCDKETKSIIAQLTTHFVKEDLQYYEMEFDEEKIELKW